MYVNSIFLLEDFRTLMCYVSLLVTYIALLAWFVEHSFGSLITAMCIQYKQFSNETFKKTLLDELSQV